MKGWSPQWLQIQRSLGFDPVADERIGERRYWELVAELHDTTGAVCTCAEPHRRLCEAQREHLDGRVALLDKAQPGHVLRWIAFVVFLLGFHFDLLAS